MNRVNLILGSILGLVSIGVLVMVGCVEAGVLTVPIL